MPRQAVTWVVTDLHLYHDKVHDYSGRPKNYMELLHANLLKYVQPQDTLIDLGDVIFYRHEKLKEFWEPIKCRAKILCMGNHDHKSRGWYTRNGYDVACTSIQVADILLSHHPQEVVPKEVRLNVHGHWHNMRGNSSLFAWWSHKTHRLLSLEEAGYKPVKLHEITR